MATESSSIRGAQTVGLEEGTWQWESLGVGLSSQLRSSPHVNHNGCVFLSKDCRLPGKSSPPRGTRSQMCPEVGLSSTHCPSCCHSPAPRSHAVLLPLQRECFQGKLRSDSDTLAAHKAHRIPASKQPCTVSAHAGHRYAAGSGARGGSQPLSGGSLSAPPPAGVWAAFQVLPGWPEGPAPCVVPWTAMLFAFPGLAHSRGAVSGLAGTMARCVPGPLWGLTRPPHRLHQLPSFLPCSCWLEAMGLFSFP